MNVFAQIRKVDEEKRLVFGRAAAEVVDKSGEIMDYAGSKPHFQKWSAEVEKDSGGKSLGNVRAMHGKVAAGLLKGIDFDDGDKAIDVSAHIVDDAEWNKVLKGVYTGFSIGGSYVGQSKVEKIDGKDVKRYVASPNEISLVDRPCIPTATFFEVQKADGTLAKVDFAPAEDDAGVDVVGSPDDVLALGKLMNDHNLTAGQTVERLQKALDADAAAAKAEADKPKPVEPVYADPVNKRFPITDAAAVRRSFISFGLAKLDDAAPLREAISKAWVEKVEKTGPPTDEPGVAAVHKAVVAELRKGMYGCQQMAGVIASLQSLMSCAEYEAYTEGDNSPLPGRLGAVIALAGQVLKEMIDEELSEIAQGETAPEMMELAAKAGALMKAHAEPLALLVKALPKHADAVRAALGIKPADAVPADVQKLLDERLAPLAKQLDETKAELARIAAQPAPTRVSLRAVSKAADVVLEHDKPAAAVEPVRDGFGKVVDSATMIKQVHQKGGQPITLKLA